MDLAAKPYATPSRHWSYIRQVIDPLDRRRSCNEGKAQSLMFRKYRFWSLSDHCLVEEVPPSSTLAHISRFGGG